jgi:hypothetical protein
MDSAQEVWQIESRLRAGHGTIGAGAEALRTGSINQVKECVERSLVLRMLGKATSAGVREIVKPAICLRSPSTLLLADVQYQWPSPLRTVSWNFISHSKNDPE